MRQKTDLDEASKVLENYRRSQRSSRYLKAGESAGHILDATREALGLVVSDLHCAFSDSLSAIVAFQELFDAPMKVLWDDKPRTALTQNDVEKVKSYVKDLGEWIIHAESVLGPIVGSFDYSKTRHPLMRLNRYKKRMDKERRSPDKPTLPLTTRPQAACLRDRHHLNPLCLI